MAPEQALGQTVDNRADLYALGVILYEMLCGSRPFSSQSQVGILGQQLSKPPPKISERAPGIVVPPAVEQVAMKLLQRESSERYQSAGEVVEVINRLLAPIPGRGIYRFTLPEGSPSNPPPPEEAQALRDAITVSSKPKQPLVPAPVPMDLLASLGAAPSSAEPESEPALGFDAKLAKLRGKLPPGAAKLVEKVSSRALFGGVAALGLLIVVGALALVFSGGSSVETPGPTAGPSSSGLAGVERAPAKEGPFARPDELAEIKSEDPKAYEALLEKYPKDPHIAVQMARDMAAKKNYPGAVGAVGRALSIDAATQNDAHVASLVFQTAQVKSSSDAAFALMEGAMGARGADIAYDLVTTPNVRPWVQSRAETFLQSSGFEKVATPGLHAIVKLRYSGGCDEKKALLPELKKSSDERALFELVPLQDKAGCGARKKDDCYPCLRTSNDLGDTIAAVRARKR
jgi:serine/threonine-protein kinase